MAKDETLPYERDETTGETLPSDGAEAPHNTARTELDGFGSTLADDSGAEGRDPPDDPPAATGPPGHRAPGWTVAEDRRGGHDLGEETGAAPGVSRAVEAPGRALPRVPGYELLGELGRGGMGVVYKARQVRLNRLCALKMILAGEHAAPEAAVRFLAEAEAVAKLHHPNIVQIHALGETGGLPYFELEYVEGGSLDRMLDGTPMPARRAARLVEHLARGVADAHRLGIVHRDLKPANVLLGPDGTPKITDFGLAKALAIDGGLTRTESVMGSPIYMAPEQAEGGAKRVGPPADVYSLGVILYELVTGRPPFRGATMLATLEQVKAAEPVAPSRLVPGLPRDLETVALKCLQKDPAKRYAEVTGLAEDLRRFLAGEVILSRRSGPLERAWRWCRRYPAEAGLAAALIGSLLAGTAVASYFSVRAQVGERRALDFADEADRRRAEAVAARDAAARQSAMLTFDKGRDLAEKGEAARGVHWMLEGLRLAEPLDWPEFRAMARVSLAAWGAQVGELRAIASHGDRVPAVAFAPDGRSFATGSRDGTIRRWDAKTGAAIGPELRLGEPSGPTPMVLALAYSPDGAVLAAGGNGPALRLFGAGTGRVLAELPTQGEVRALAFDPGGAWLAEGGTGRVVRLWDLDRRQPLIPPLHHDDIVQSIAVSPDGRVVLTSTGHYGSGSGQARRWDPATGRPLGPPLPFDDMARVVAFGPSGAVFLVGAFDGTVRLFDAATGSPRGDLPHPTGVAGAAFTPDGALIATGDLVGTIRLWDARNAQLLCVLHGHEQQVEGLAFSPDGRRLLTGAADRTARLRDLPSGASRLGPAAVDRSQAGGRGAWRSDMLNIERRFRAAAFRPDGRLLVVREPVPLGQPSHGRGAARAVDPVTGRPVFPPLTHAEHIRVIRFSPDGRTLATGGNDQTARLWDARTGRPLGPPMQTRGNVTALAFSPDGSRLAVGTFTPSGEGHLHFWDVPSGRELGLPVTQPDAVLASEFSPDGRTLAVGLADRGQLSRVRLWDLSARRQVGESMRYGSFLDFRPDGHAILTGATDPTARLWDAATGRPLGPPMPHVRSFQGAAWLPDGVNFISLSGDGNAHHWDGRTGRPLGPPLSHPAQVTPLALAIDRDGRSVAVGYADGSTWLWDLATARPLGPPFLQSNPVLAVTFSADGRTLLTATLDGNARSWPARTPPQGADLRRFDDWLQACTGLRFDPEVQSVVPLGVEAWRRLAERARPLVEPIGDGAWHDARARDAEQDGDDFAALWHLDRLIALDPGDWFLYARRARAHADANRLERAAADTERALRCGPRDALLAWSEQCAARSRTLRRWPTALWYLDRLIAARPDDPGLKSDRDAVVRAMGGLPPLPAEPFAR